MAAAKALLSAAGLLKHNKKLLKKSTATEHATSSSPPDPAASTDDVSRLPLTGLPMSTSKLQASASEDGYLLGDNDLEKIVALLLWMAQDFQSNIHIDDIHYAALEVVIKHVDAATGGTLGSLHTASVAKLSELIDIMMTDKTGALKDPNATLIFMRRVARVREEVLATSIDNATERVESSAGPALTLKAPTCPPRLTPKAPTVPPPARSAAGRFRVDPGRHGEVAALEGEDATGSLELLLLRPDDRPRARKSIPPGSRSRPATAFRTDQRGSGCPPGTFNQLRTR